MSTREALLAVTETAYGVTKTTPVVNTDSWYYNLPDSDCFSGVMNPVLQVVDYGGGQAVPFDVMTDHYATELTWKGNVYPTLDDFLLKFFLQRSNGSTTPWVNAEPSGDLASATFYKLWTVRAGTVVRKKYLGCKGREIQLTCGRDKPILSFSAKVVAQKEQGNAVESGPPADPDATEFPAPTDTQLPTGPYLFSHSSTNLSVGGAAVTNYLSVNYKATNTLDVLYFETKFPAEVVLTGRTQTLTFQRLLGTSPNYRTRWQGVADYATYLKFDNGTHSFKIDLGARCHVSAYAQQLTKGKEFLETVTVTGRWDTATGTDAVLTLA